MAACQNELNTYAQLPIHATGTHQLSVEPEHTEKARTAAQVHRLRGLLIEEQYDFVLLDASR